MAYSVVALKFDSKTDSLIELAAHERLKEVLAIEASDENLYIAAEREGHLFVVEKCHEEGVNDEPILETVSVWHLGDVIRKFRFGMCHGIMLIKCVILNFFTIRFFGNE
jgi:DNA damage-binding protein 1